MPIDAFRTSDVVKWLSILSHRRDIYQKLLSVFSNDKFMYI